MRTDLYWSRVLSTSRPYLFDDVDVEAGLLNLGLQMDPLLTVGCCLCQLVQELKTGHLETGARTGGRQVIDPWQEIAES